MNILQKATFSKKDCKTLSQQMIYSSFVKVEKLHIQHKAFNQSQFVNIQRENIIRPAAAGALLYNHHQQKFLLIEQFRVGAMHDEHSPWQLEIIAGVLDGNESPETCIKRECLEEAGCEVTQLTHLFKFFPSAGACSEVFDLYAAECQIPEQGGIFGMPDEGENILVHIFDYHDIDTLFENQRLRNAPVIMALQWLRAQIKSQHINSI